MRIIAHGRDGTVLVSMTHRELSNVIGYSYEHQIPGNRHSDLIKPGSEFAVSPAWNRLQDQAQAAEKLEGVSKTLTALADLVTQTKVAYTNATAEGGAK